MTIRISLKEFFRTGSFGPVTVGMMRDEVERLLGKPTAFYNHFDEEADYHQAPLWFYAGVEFSFGDLTSHHIPDDQLVRIMFKPRYLYKGCTEPATLDPWIFRTRKGPTHSQLIRALTSSKIAFEDKGVVKVGFDARNRLLAFPLDSSDMLESFEITGLIRLESGFEIIYGDTDLIHRALIGEKYGESVIGWEELMA